jgi:hypothetical protein
VRREVSQRASKRSFHLGMGSEPLPLIVINDGAGKTSGGKLTMKVEISGMQTRPSVQFPLLRL